MGRRRWRRRLGGRWQRLSLHPACSKREYSPAAERVVFLENMFAKVRCGWMDRSRGVDGREARGRGRVRGMMMVREEERSSSGGRP